MWPVWASEEIPAEGAHPPCPLTSLNGFLWIRQFLIKSSHGDVPPSGPAEACVAGLLAFELIQIEVSALLHHRHSIIVSLRVSEKGQCE